MNGPEITGGLPDDSREEDERQEERRLRDLRGRVKHARAVVVTTPGLAEILASDWQRASGFYARFGIAEKMFRHGDLADDAPGEGPTDAIWHPMNALAVTSVQTQAVLPSLEERRGITPRYLWYWSHPVG